MLLCPLPCGANEVLGVCSTDRVEYRSGDSFELRRTEFSEEQFSDCHVEEYSRDGDWSFRSFECRRLAGLVLLLVRLRNECLPEVLPFRLLESLPSDGL